MKDILDFIADHIIAIVVVTLMFGESTVDAIVRIIKAIRGPSPVVVTPPPPKAPRLRVHEGKVFLVNGPDGESRVVHADDEAEALKIAARDLRADEAKLVAVEVYEKVLRGKR